MNALLLLMTLSSVAIIYASEDEHANGRELYARHCVGCHGEKGEGNVMLKAPRIGGQEFWYLEAQLRKFKDGIRGGNLDDPEGMMMAPMAKLLATPEDIKDVSSYVAVMKPPKPVYTIRGNPHNGQKQYAACIICHGHMGQGKIEFRAPAIAGLDDWYALRQLKHFKSGVRGSHPEDYTGKQMKYPAQSLVSEQAMKDIISYIRLFPR